MKHNQKLLVMMLTVVMFVFCLLGVAACEPNENENDNKNEKTTYTVTFETVGGTAISPSTVQAGKTVSRPSNPTKTGAEFVDWYTSSTYDGEPYNFSTPVNANLTLYAKWSDADYAVVFDVNGGSPVIEYATYKHGSVLNAPDAPSRVGYSFTGWYTDAGCKNQASFPYEVTKHTRFYAGWESTRDVTVSFKIAYLQNDTRDINYDENILDSVTVKAGEKLTQPDNPKDISYIDGKGTTHTLKFSYWNFNPTYSATQTKAVLFPVTYTDVEEITLYAVYTEVGENDVYASLTVHPNNGEEATVMYGVQGQTLSIGNLNDLNPAPFYSDSQLPRKAGYEVDGYFKTADFASGTVFEIPFLLENEENDVYIRWEKHDDITVTFDYGFNEINATAAANQYRGLVARPENKLIEGYTFDGWYTARYSAAEEYRWNFDIDFAAEDITLYAKYVKTATVIKYETCGGYERNPIAVSQGHEVTYLPVPVRQTGDIAYNFLGWYFDEQYTKEAKAPLTVTSDITLFAKWSDSVDLSMFDILDLGNSSGYSVRVRTVAKNDIAGSVTVPMRYGGELIVRIETNGFEDCINITQLTVPDSVTIVGNYAFQGCKSLEKIVLPDSLKQIGAYAFKNCEKLSDVNFPSQIISINADIFRTAPLMQEKLEQDENGMFYWGTAFLGKSCYVKGKKIEDNETTSLTVRQGTTVAAVYSLYYMNALKEVTFADSVRYLPSNIFEDSEKCVVETINLPASYEDAMTLTTFFPSSVKTLTLDESNENFSIVNGCLIRNKDMQLIASTAQATAIPDGTVIIGKNSFRNKPIDTVLIPDTVTAIYANAFKDCDFTSVVLPDSVGVLDSTAFAGCSEMLSIKFGAGINLQNADLFADMKRLSSLEVSENNPYMLSLSSVLYRQGNFAIIYFAKGYTGEVALYDELETLPASIFNSANISRLVIPDSVGTIENGALSGMFVGTLAIGKNTPLIDIGQTGSFTLRNGAEVSADNPYMTAVDGVLYNKDVTKLLQIPSSLTSYVFPDTVTEVQNKLNMSYVQDVTIGTGISLNTFEFLVFDNNSRTERIDFYPETVNVSSNHAELAVFEGVVYTKDKKHIVFISGSFDGNLILPKEMETLDEILLSRMPKYIDGGWDDAGVHINTLSVEAESRLTSISDVAFADYIEANSATDRLPDWFDSDYQSLTFDIDKIDLSAATGLTSVGEKAFTRKESLKEVIFPASVENIGSSAFFECKKLQSVTGLDDNVQIGSQAFYGCTELFDENGFLTIGNVLYGFDTARADKGSTVVLPDTVKKIAANAFVLTNLRSIVIPSTVERVCASAILYYGQTELAVYVESTDTVLEENWSSATNSRVVSIKNGVSEDGTYFFLDETTGLYYRLSSDKTASVLNDLTATEAWSGEVELSSAITYGNEQYTLTEIAVQAFYSNSDKVTKIVLPNTLQKIGNYAFANMILTEIALPDSVTEIGYSLFHQTTTLEQVTFSKNISVVPSSTFSDNAKLTTFDFSGIEEIGEGAFKNCGLTQADLSNVKSIAKNAFAGCSALNAVTFSQELESIGSYAFYETALTEIYVPASVAEIGDYAFAVNDSVEKVTLATGIAGKGAFQQNTALTTVEFVGGKEYSVGVQVFYQCSKLTAVSFGAGLTNIGTYAFMESAVTKLSLPSSLKSIGDYAFYNCAKLDTVTFQEGLASVGKYSFQGTAVTELSLPASLTEYGEGAFFSCASLKSIAFADGSTKVGSKNAFQCKALESVTFGSSSGLTIAVQTFYGATALKSVSFADDCVVKEIGNYAFGNTALTELRLPQVEKMGKQVFYHCTALKLTIPYAADAIPQDWAADWNTSSDAKIIYAE